MAAVIAIPNGSRVAVIPGENALEAARQAAIATSKAATAAAYANQPFGEPIPGEPSGNRSALHFAAIASQYSEQSKNAAGYDTRAELLGWSYAVDGDRSSVFNDPGQHAAVAGEYRTNGTLATVGEMIPNDGRYTYQASPAAWLRTSNIDSQDAAESASAATAAVSATREAFGVDIYNGGSAILEGIYNGDYNAASSYTINRFTVVIEDATTGATVDVWMRVNGTDTYGPITVTYGTTLTTTPSFSLPSGAADSYRIERITGTIRSLYIRADGVPA